MWRVFLFVMIELRDLSYKQRNFGPVTLSLAKGQVVLLCGPSGSGKSTLCQLLLGELDPTQGLVSWEPDVRYGFLGGDVESQLLGSSVGQEFEFAQQQSLKSRSSHWMALEETVLSRFQDKLELDPHELSRGEQQILLLSSMLLGPYSCLVLDEGLSGLDHSAFESFCQLLRDVAGAGGLVIVVSHEARFLRWCDRVVGLKEGTVVLDRCRGDVTWSDFCRVQLWAGALLPGAPEERVEESFVAQPNEGERLGVSLGAVSWSLPVPWDFRLFSGQSLAVTGVSGSGKSRWLTQVLDSAQLSSLYRVMLTECCSSMLWRRTVATEIEVSLSLGRGRGGDCPDYLGVPEDWLDKSPRALSLGQRKLVTCYCLLLQRPDLLLMEEPFSGLDHDLREVLVGWLRQYLASGGGLIFSTHSPDELWLYPNFLLFFEREKPTWMGGSWSEFVEAFPEEKRLGFPGFRS